MTDPYAPHAEFIRPAWQTPEIWRVLVMVVSFEVVFALSPFVFAAFLPTETAVDAFYEGTSAFGTLAQFFSFGVSAIGFLVLLRLLHRRGFWSLVGPASEAKRDLIRVAWAVAVWLLILEFLPPWINTADLAEVRDFAAWVVLVPIAILALLIQVGTEEIIFRGYLQQQFACISRSRWAWMFVPSAMFGALHFWNGNGAADGTIWALWATALGIACADLTARSGNLGAAIGLHLANNAFALLVVGVQGWPSSGVALFLYPYEDPELYSLGIAALWSPWVVFQLLTMILSVAIMWLAARIAIQR
ncbi:MAG: CPBP family intramembrane metalloprotease [Yoonia sp.]|uniref:CPBP family intramembrane glutamic endopeptidase n=1 Tax=Yoonia sp. TaxID=2212373 RepID=UPI00273DAFC3|nr:type II CAAX endopeptidase family protein [Yoonia sp.]MDP5084923.1 CPBP family intramembrane metalloprotease [Yoonia sp.]MDP5362612.1 CPBP family intramembrane metalloprotease [Paracoccaceae bacterium]